MVLMTVDEAILMIFFCHLRVGRRLWRFEEMVAVGVIRAKDESVAVDFVAQDSDHLFLIREPVRYGWACALANGSLDSIPGLDVYLDDEARDWVKEYLKVSDKVVLIKDPLVAFAAFATVSLQDELFVSVDVCVAN